MLRDYQRRAIDQLYDWFNANPSGNPCLVLPTGAGKSHIVAALCKEAVQAWPQTKILMLTHVKELIEQNAEKMRQHWPNAPLGLYSAGLNRKDIDHITFGGIQSLRTKAKRLGHIDLIIIDECHLINNSQQGGYRQLLADLMEINPALRVIGLTATPYRLGQGKVTEGDDALFQDLIEPVDIAELVERGFLAPLKSKHTYSAIDVSNAKKRGGEYVAKDIEDAAEAVIESAVGETILRAENRKHWLFFCSGVKNAQHAADVLNANGIAADCLTGEHTKAQREAILEQFTSGKLQALTNANILTTGFDYPDIDLIAFLRPTMSPSLYMQMAGRGMRLKSHTDHCLVLDFAGNVERHGPVTNVQPPRRGRSSGTAEAPVKICPDCYEQVMVSVMCCPECGYIWKAKPKPMKLSNADIMGYEPMELDVTDWKWSKHTSRSSGKEMVKVKYYGGLSDPVITEYFPITHDGVVKNRAYNQLREIALESFNTGSPTALGADALVRWFNTGKPPSMIKYIKNGKFYEVKARLWNTTSQIG